MLPQALPYVYKITHKTTGQFYIGSRTHKNQKHHSLDFGIKYSTSSKLVKSLGFENFNIDWIEEFECKDTAYKFEQLIIFESFKDPLCLNKSCYFGKQKFSTTGVSPDEKWRNKIAKTLTGYKHSQESKDKMSKNQTGELNGFYGKTHTQESKDKMSFKHKGKPSSRKGQIGIYFHSQESKDKMSKQRKGKLKSTQTKQNMARAFKNRPKYQCPYCPKSADAGNYKQWHGDNCKFKP